LLFALEPPPRIEGRELGVAALLPLAEVSVGQLFHTQQERLLPTPTSSPVTKIKPMTNIIPPAIRLRMRIERRLAGAREANLENGCLTL
jgi:hypothetical protein